MENKSLPKSFIWMGLTLTIAFGLSGWAQVSSLLVIAAVVAGIGTAVYATLVSRQSKSAVE